MGLPISEQEVMISYMRDSNECRIYASDSTAITKLDKLAENPDAPYWELLETHRTQDGEIVGKTYKTHKRLISFRSGFPPKRELTEEQRKALAERMARAKGTTGS